MCLSQEVDHDIWLHDGVSHAPAWYCTRWQSCGGIQRLYSTHGHAGWSGPELQNVSMIFFMVLSSTEGGRAAGSCSGQAYLLYVSTTIPIRYYINNTSSVRW